MNKEMIKTSSELEPSSIASSLNWFLLSALSSLSELLIFVWALLLQRILYVVLPRRRLGRHRVKQSIVYLSIVQNVFVPCS